MFNTIVKQPLHYTKPPFGNSSTVITAKVTSNAKPLHIAPAISTVEKAWEKSWQIATRNKVSSPEISVIIPVYNVENFLPETLKSLQVQSHKNWEAILVDDGSTDQSLKVAKKIAENDPRIIVIEGPHAGLPAASKNWMAKKARGKYISQMDSDDLFAHPAVLEKQVEYLKRNETIHLVCSPAERIDVKGNPLSSFRHDRALEPAKNNAFKLSRFSQSTWKNLLEGNFVSHFQASMIPKEKWLDIPKIKYYEDYLWYVKLAVRDGIQSIKMLPFKGFQWRKNPNSLTQSKTEVSKDIESIRVRNHVLSEENGIPREYKSLDYLSKIACKQYLWVLNKVQAEHKSHLYNMEIIKEALLDANVNKSHLNQYVIEPHIKIQSKSNYIPE